ncbi:MAG: hypothetical protein OEZ29_04065 [Candidatus Bathyarchaeota archaeon]|nr:hypothetical protein [Candidatus Bathyarchaeota archaeon]
MKENIKAQILTPAALGRKQRLELFKVYIRKHKGKKRPEIIAGFALKHGLRLETVKQYYHLLRASGFISLPKS